MSTRLVTSIQKHRILSFVVNSHFKNDKTIKKRHLSKLCLCQGDTQVCVFVCVSARVFAQFTLIRVDPTMQPLNEGDSTIGSQIKYNTSAMVKINVCAST